MSFLLAALMVGSLLGVAVFGRTDVNAQAAPPESASYVPADALLFLTIDLDVTSTPWLQAAILAQRVDQTLTPEQLFESLSGSVLGEQAARIDPALFIGGEATIAVIDPDIAGVVEDVMPAGGTDAGGGLIDVSVTTAEITQGVVLITLPPDVAAAAAAMETALADQAEADGVAVETTTYEGVETRSIPANAESGRPGIAVAQIDDAIVAAAAASELEPVIDVRVAGSPSMVDDDFVSTVLEPLPADYLAIGVLNGPAAAESAGAVSGVGTITEVIVPGGDNAVSGFALSAVNEGFRIDTRSASTNGEPVAGMNDPFDAELIERMPAETQVLIDGYNFGATGVLDAAVVLLFELFFGSLDDSFAPFEAEATPTAVPDVSLEDAAREAYFTLGLLLGVNLQTDLVELLDGEYAVGVWGLEGSNLADANAMMIARTSDPDTVRSTLTTLTNFLGVGPTVAADATPGSTGDSFLTVIDLSTDGTEIAPVSIGVVGDELIIGYGNGGEVALEGSDGSLSDTELFTAVTAELPQERSFLMFVNLDSLQSTLQPDGASGAMGMITSGQAFALAGFQDGDLAGTQGLLYIPEP